MKLLFLFTIFLVSCSSLHTVPENSGSRHAIEYCGGELWGYVLPIGPREETGFWSRKREDPKPLLAVFMHMHSVLEKDPEHSLTFHIAMRTREDLTVQFLDRNIVVQIEGRDEKKFPIDLIVTEEALGINDLYPSTKYETKLVDPRSNRWQVAKRNSFATFVTDTPEVVTLPTSQNHKITNEPLSLKFNKEKYGQIYVLSSTNIWPEQESLKDTTVVVRLPSFILNGTTYPPQSFTFNTNYENVRKHRGSYGRCPSTEEIFRFNTP